MLDSGIAEFGPATLDLILGHNISGKTSILLVD